MFLASETPAISFKEDHGSKIKIINTQRVKERVDVLLVYSKNPAYHANLTRSPKVDGLIFTGSEKKIIQGKKRKTIRTIRTTTNIKNVV